MKASICENARRPAPIARAWHEAVIPPPHPRNALRKSPLTKEELEDENVFLRNRLQEEQRRNATLSQEFKRLTRLFQQSASRYRRLTDYVTTLRAWIHGSKLSITETGNGSAHE